MLITLLAIFVFWTIVSDVYFFKQSSVNDFFVKEMNVIHDEINQLQEDVEDLQSEIGMSAFDENGNIKV